MTACPPHQRRPPRRVSDEEVSLAQHFSHDTAVDDRLSWRAADFGAAVMRPATQNRYKSIFISEILNSNATINNNKQCDDRFPFASKLSFFTAIVLDEHIHSTTKPSASPPAAISNFS